MNRRRFKILTISNRFLQDIIGNVATIITKDNRILTFDGIPDNIHLLDIYKDITRDCLDFAICSESFPEVPEGCLGEYIMVTIREAPLEREEIR